MRQCLWVALALDSAGRNLQRQRVGTRFLVLRVAGTTIGAGSPESQHGLRRVNGVPVWNGDMLTRWVSNGPEAGEQNRALGRSLGKFAGTHERGGSGVQTSRL